MTNEKLQNFFEENDFNVYLFKEDNIQCGEIERWTDGGVDMIILLRPFEAKEFTKYVDDFDADEEIDLHRQGKLYKRNFTIRRSLEDFTDFHNDLKKVSNELETL
ncbi:MAG: hypothetical protein U9P79_06090 [Candidatus Cloacimonadota bacterium]|nr:hypothetical protein [Candidatus Cloacimonadota bacterium]